MEHSRSQHEDRYLVKYLQEENALEVWSEKRLPFEPQEWLVDLRAEIRTALRDLKCGPHQLLHAIYGARNIEFCDIENILLYNVGGGHFASLARYGIRLERSFTYPNPPEFMLTQKPHYHHYTAADTDTGFINWRVGQILAQWDNVIIPQLSSSTKIPSIWYPISTNSMKVIHNPKEEPKHFGLKVIISAQANKAINIANLVKPLLDGIISSFHAHNRENIEILSQRIGVSLGQNPDDIAKLLCRKDRAILGQRQLVWLRKSGVQWNPSDDCCLAFEVVVQTHKDKDWLISGSLFEIDYMDKSFMLD